MTTIAHESFFTPRSEGGLDVIDEESTRSEATNNVKPPPQSPPAAVTQTPPAPSSNEQKKKKVKKSKTKFPKMNPFKTGAGPDAKKPANQKSHKQTLKDPPQSYPSSRVSTTIETDVEGSNKLESLSSQQLEKEATNMYKLGVAFGNSNPNAISYFDRSLKAQEILHGAHSSPVADIHEKLGDIFKAINQSEDALGHYEYALKIFRVVENSENYKDAEERKEMIDLRKRVTESLIEVEARMTQQPAEPTSQSNRSASSDRKSANKKPSVRWETKETNWLNPKEHIEVYREIERLGDYEGETGQLEKAIIYYKNAVMLLRRQLDQDHEFVLSVQVKLADTLMRSGHLMEAISLHDQLAPYLQEKREKNIYYLKVMIYNSTGQSTNEHFAPIFKVEKMGDKFLETGSEGTDFDQAISFYKKALDMFLNIEGMKPGSKHILRIHVKLGTVAWMADEQGNMMHSYSKALKYFEDQGDKLAEDKDYENASCCYTQALRFLLKITDPANTAVQRIQIKIGDVCLKTGAAQAALELYELASSYIAEDEYAAYYQILNKISSAHESLGDMDLAKKDGDSALSHFQESLNIYRSLHYNKGKKTTDAPKEARTLDKIGEAYFMIENYDEAETSYLESLKVRSSKKINQGALPREDLEGIANAKHKLGSIYYFTNRYSEAEDYFKEAIARKTKLYESFDKKVLLSKLALCLLYQKTGDKEKAFQEYSALLDEFEKVEPGGQVLGTEYFVTSHQLAKLSTEKGDLDNAFRIYARQLKKLQAWQKVDRLLIFNTLRDMGEILAVKGEFKSAIKYFEMALEESEKITTGHQDALDEQFYVRLGYCYACINEREKALSFYAKAMNDEVPTPDKQPLFINIGTQLAKQEQYEEALKWFHTCTMFIRERDNYDIVMRASNNIGNVYHSLNDEKNALKYYEDALNYSKEIQMELPSLYNLGNLYLQKGETKKAKGFFEKFLVSVDKIGNREYKALKANGLNNIGNILVEEEKYDEAVVRYSEALKLKTEIYGGESLDIFGTLKNLGGACYKLGTYDNAKKYYAKALHLTTVHEVESTKTSIVLTALGGISMINKHYNDALDYFKKAYVIENESHDGEDHKDLLLCRYKIGLVRFRQMHYQDAIDCFEDVHERMSETLGYTDANTIRVLLSLAEVYIKLEKLNIAKEKCLDALEALEDGEFAPNHPCVKRARKILARMVNYFLK